MPSPSAQTTAPQTLSPPSTAPARLVSVDALRGFDMFWIIGADSLVQGLKELSEWPPVQFAAAQLEHSVWHGMTFYDLIFPLFVFVMGLSVPLSLARRLSEGGSRWPVYVRLLRRFVVLYLLGVLYYYDSLKNHWPDIRLVGVLQRIAVCYLAGSLIYLNFRPRGQMAWLVGLLLGYWALMALVPVPGHGAGDYDRGANLANYIDQQYLPGRAWEKDGWDPEGLLSTIPAVGSCLIGVLCGQLLVSPRIGPQRRVLWFALIGAGCLAAGYAWNLWFPINKRIWTSSFVLVAGGYSCLLLAVFYQLIDIWQLRRWATPFVIIGANAITVYMAENLIPLHEIAQRFVGGDVADWLGRLDGIVSAAVQLALVFGLAWWLYAKRIFIRI
jgi:predicted acyltransferase